MATMKITSKLDSRNYERGINKIKRKTQTFGDKLGDIKSLMKKVFVVGAIAAFTKKIKDAVAALVNYASELKNLSDQAGVNVESFQLLGKAATMVGEDLNTVRDALGAIKTAQGEVLEGDEGMLKNFQALGVSIDDIARMGIDELFVKIGEAVGDAGMSAKEFAALSKIIGEGDALKLRQAFEAAGEGLDDLDSKFVQVDQRSVVALDRMEKGWGNIKTTAKNVATNLIGSLVGVFQSQEKIDAAILKSQENIALQKEANAQQFRDLQEKQEKERVAALEKIRVEEEKAASARSKQIQKIAESVKIEIESDGVRRIGGMVGGGVSNALRYARQQAETLAKIEDYQSSLPAIERNTAANRGLQ